MRLVCLAKSPVGGLSFPTLRFSFFLFRVAKLKPAKKKSAPFFSAPRNFSYLNSE